MLTFLLAQAVAGPVLPAPTRPRSDKPCPVAVDSDDVIVCAGDQEGFRLRPAPPRYERQGLPKAEIGIGGMKLAAEAEAGGLPGGVQTNRAMVRLKVPLGRKR